MKRLVFLVAILALAGGCGDDDGPDAADLVSTTTAGTTTLAPATTMAPPVVTAADPATTTTVVTTAPTSTTVPGPTTTVAAGTTVATTTTTSATEPAVLVEAADLAGSLSLDADSYESGAALTVTLTVTNVSDHPVSLEDRADLRYLAVRASIGGSALDSSYLWLGDAELDPGAQHAMSRSWTPALSAEAGAEVDFDTVIAESADSFNRVQNTVAVVPAVPRIVLPVSG